MDNAKKTVEDSALAPDEVTSLSPTDPKEGFQEVESYGVETPTERVYPSGLSKPEEVSRQMTERFPSKRFTADGKKRIQQ